MDAQTFRYLLLGWIALAIVLFPVQLFVTAPYGRHARQGWGPTLDNRLGWVLMEIVSPIVLLFFFLRGEVPKTAPMWVFVGLWVAHYLHRALIFPLRMRTRGKRIPLSIVLSAVFFNVVNAGTNGYYLGSLAPPYPEGWFGDPRFLLGLALFLFGAFVNLDSDNRLLRLRKPGETGYRIPQGGLFRWVSCPNHLGEILEWAGFAILCWNLPALAFAVWTAANLTPRALSHHRWYREKFPNYPPERKALIPKVL
ncbi:MAG: DUF1295 domain-containing protein [Bacteroidetes bacterium]|nr:MAG: DUF1295 domain-containing protein [Bacteroidota bacterium]